jgi:hypothetical protein
MWCVVGIVIVVATYINNVVVGPLPTAMMSCQEAREERNWNYLGICKDIFWLK